MGTALLLTFLNFLIILVHMNSYKHSSKSSFTSETVALLFVQ